MNPLQKIPYQKYPSREFVMQMSKYSKNTLKPLKPRKKVLKINVFLIILDLLRDPLLKNRVLITFKCFW